MILQSNTRATEKTNKSKSPITKQNLTKIQLSPKSNKASNKPLPLHCVHYVILVLKLITRHKYISKVLISIWYI